MLGYVRVRLKLLSCLVLLFQVFCQSLPPIGNQESWGFSSAPLGETNKRFGLGTWITSIVGSLDVQNIHVALIAFVDDLYLFARNASEAKIMLAELQDELRRIGLHFQKANIKWEYIGTTIY